MEEYVLDSEDFSVSRYNELLEEGILNEKELISIDDSALGWNIPEKYLTLPVMKFVYTKLEKEFLKRNFTYEEEDERIARVQYEFSLWNDIGMFELLRVLIYIVDMFEESITASIRSSIG